MQRQMHLYSQKIPFKNPQNWKPKYILKGPVRLRKRSKALTKHYKTKNSKGIIEFIFVGLFLLGKGPTLKSCLYPQ